MTTNKKTEQNETQARCLAQAERAAKRAERAEAATDRALSVSDVREAERQEDRAEAALSAAVHAQKEAPEPAALLVFVRRAEAAAARVGALLEEDGAEDGAELAAAFAEREEHATLGRCRACGRLRALFEKQCADCQ